ncbi:hypothetical protein [Sandarakinorhabdus sp.]|uniref:hypothetical protein n=1 Tax=Sandarakinorhabdus sp. TaxID=1916663 RepID=UPI003F70C7AE
MTHIFKPAILLAPLAVLLVAAAPTTPPTTGPTSSLAMEMAREERLAQAAGLIDDNETEAALSLLDALLAQADLPADRGQVEALRSFALARQGKIPEARAAIEFAADATMNPTLLLLRQLFVLRAITGDVPAAGQTLQLMAVSDPKWLQQLPAELVSQVLVGTTDPNLKFDLAYTLVGANYAPKDETVAAGDWLKLQVITGLATRGRLDEAQPFIEKLLNPVSLVRLAIDRRYQSLWPALEARLGPGADKADAAYLTASKAALDAAPENVIARLGHAQALNIASKEKEALALADTAKTTEDMAKLPDNGLWLVNLAAQLLVDLGQVDAGLARYTTAASLDTKDRPSLTGLLINHALLADQAGRADAALAAADVAERKMGKDMNDFGKLYLAAVRACARHRQGDSTAATTALAPLLAAPDRNDDAYFQAMLCVGRNDDAARAIIKRLDDPDKRSEALFELQPFLIADHAELPGRRSRADLRALKARADVKAAFAKWGRDLPAAVSPPR